MAASESWRINIAAAFEWLGGAEESFEVCLGALLSQKHHADGQGYFRVDHVLRKQVFSQVAGDEHVVLRLTQERSDPFKSFDEFGEVAVSVAPAHFLFGDDDAMAGRQRTNGRGLDGSFQVQVELCFGEGSDSVGERRGFHP